MHLPRPFRVAREALRSVKLPDDPRLDQRYFGLDDIDQKMERYLDFDHGIFVEAGANDGISQSNTLHLEKYRGWRGLLVEPVPELAWRCRRNRRGSKVVNCALGEFSQRGSTVELTYCNLMSVVKGALKSPEAERAHLAAGAEVQELETYRFKARCRALSDLIDRYRLPEIDFMSLDVEGFELSVLKGVDLGRHRPRYLLVEARFREEIVEHLHPYFDVVDELSHHDVLFRAKR
jgi:FkbM family methyltransferase